MADPTYDSFAGTNILIASSLRGPATPQRIQMELLPGIDGGRAINHGRAPRAIEVVGYAVANTATLLKGIEITIRQSLVGVTGTFIHYVNDAGSVVAVSYYYSRLVEYYLHGPVGLEATTNRRSQSVYARLMQDYW